MLNAILQHQFIYIMAISLQDRKGELPVKDTNLLQVTDKRHHKRHHNVITNVITKSCIRYTWPCMWESNFQISLYETLVAMVTTTASLNISNYSYTFFNYPFSTTSKVDHEIDSSFRAIVISSDI